MNSTDSPIDNLNQFEIYRKYLFSPRLILIYLIRMFLSKKTATSNKPKQESTKPKRMLGGKRIDTQGGTTRNRRSHNRFQSNQSQHITNPPSTSSTTNRPFYPFPRQQQPPPRPISLKRRITSTGILSTNEQTCTIKITQNHREGHSRVDRQAIGYTHQAE
jgi:hypothetical protein